MVSSNLSALFGRPGKQKGCRSLVRENQQSDTHNFVKDFPSISSDFSSDMLPIE